MCNKRSYCKYGNNINRYCNSCIKNYEEVRYYPANATNKFSEGKPVKLIVFNESSMESIRNDFIKKGNSECDFYKAFWEWAIEQEHFEPKVFRFDG